MMHMDAFEELGITAAAQAPRPRSKVRSISAVLATIVAGTAVTASVIFALVLVITVAWGAYAIFLEQNKSPTDSCDPIIGCVP
jgi:hypothetical protein